MKPISLLFLFGLLAFSSHAQNLQLEPLAEGFNNVVDIASAGDDRIFAVERPGVIKVISASGEVRTFMDINSRVIQTGGQSEQGLLGLAFHPNYAENGYFYVHYIDNAGDTQISRFSVDPSDPDRGISDTESAVLNIAQPYVNHNGGDLEFGPDGYLYIGMGDGGQSNDPGNRSQNPLSLHGKMLRIDIDTDAGPYAIPADNPFVGRPDTLPEIWSLGLRNPWRFSFDPETGDLWIADVGQWSQEEINFQPAASTGGENYGWRCREGDRDNPNVGNNGCVDPSNYVEPVQVYAHEFYGPCSVTGGFVYRSCVYPELKDFYLYADYCSGDIWGLRPDGQGGWTNENLLRIPNGAWTTFGQGADGEIYLAGLNDNSIYHVTRGNAFDVIELEERPSGELTAPEDFEAYQWLLDGSPIADATDPTYLPTVSGDYRVELRHPSGCEYLSEAITVIITQHPEVIGLERLTITPNPFESELLLDFYSPTSTKLTLRLYRVDGRTILEDRVAGVGQWQHRLTVSDLEAGVYLLSVAKGGKQVVRKVIKQ
ncbi:MAG: PQQ-dependent sugar dehydrogenase [Bacteroidota bacterium]